MTQISRELAEKLMAHVRGQTDQFLQNNNLQMQLKCAFSSEKMNLKMCVTPKMDKNVEAKKTWDRNCSRVEMKPEDFGREFGMLGKKFNISGFVEGAKKYPILMLRQDDHKTYKFTTQQLNLMTTTQTTPSPTKEKTLGQILAPAKTPAKQKTQSDAKEKTATKKQKTHTDEAPPPPYVEELSRPWCTTMQWCTQCHICMSVGRDKSSSQILDWETGKHCVKQEKGKYLCFQCEEDLKLTQPRSHIEQCTSCKKQLVLVDTKKVSPREWKDEVFNKTVRITNERDPKDKYMYFCWECKLQFYKAQQQSDASHH